MNLQYWNSPGHIVTPSYKNNKKPQQQTRPPPPKRHFAAPTRTRSRAAAPEPKPHPFSRCSKNTLQRFISHRLRPFSHNSPGGARWRQRAGEEFSGVGRVIDGEHSQVSSASFFLIRFTQTSPYAFMSFGPCKQNDQSTKQNLYNLTKEDCRPL